MSVISTLRHFHDLYIDVIQSNYSRDELLQILLKVLKDCKKLTRRCEQITRSLEQQNKLVTVLECILKEYMIEEQAENIVSLSECLSLMRIYLSKVTMFVDRAEELIAEDNSLGGRAQRELASSLSELNSLARRTLLQQQQQQHNGDAASHESTSESDASADSPVVERRGRPRSRARSQRANKRQSMSNDNRTKKASRRYRRRNMAVTSQSEMDESAVENPISPDSTVVQSTNGSIEGYGEYTTQSESEDQSTLEIENFEVSQNIPFKRFKASQASSQSEMEDEHSEPYARKRGRPRKRRNVYARKGNFAAVSAESRTVIPRVDKNLLVILKDVFTDPAADSDPIVRQAKTKHSHDNRNTEDEEYDNMQEDDVNEEPQSDEERSSYICSEFDEHQSQVVYSSCNVVHCGGPTTPPPREDLNYDGPENPPLTADCYGETSAPPRRMGPATPPSSPPSSIDQGSATSPTHLEPGTLPTDQRPVTPIPMSLSDVD